MWFDARARLAEIEGRAPAEAPSSRQAGAAGVAVVAGVAAPPPRKSRPPPRADGLDPDAGAYLDRLQLHGPATYGAMAAALGWGATRAWRAEARLRAAGLVTMAAPCGVAVPVAETVITSGAGDREGAR